MRIFLISHIFQFCDLAMSNVELEWFYSTHWVKQNSKKYFRVLRINIRHWKVKYYNHNVDFYFLSELKL